MTPSIYCQSMRATLTKSGCESQQKVRECCLTCGNRNVSIVQTPLLNGFNSSRPRKLPVVRVKKRAVVRIKNEPKLRQPKVKQVQSPTIKARRCSNCKLIINDHHKFCGVCEKANRLPGIEVSLRLATIKRDRKAGKIHRGRKPGFLFSPSFIKAG